MIYWPYVIPLFAACLMALAGDLRMKRAAIIISGVYVVGQYFIFFTGITDAYYVSFALDAIAAYLLIARPDSRIGRWSFAKEKPGVFGAVMSVTYVFQIILHAIYVVGLSKGAADAYAYWWNLTLVAWAQLAILGAGSFWHGLGEPFRRDLHDGDGGTFASAHRDRLP